MYIGFGSTISGSGFAGVVVALAAGVIALNVGSSAVRGMAVISESKPPGVLAAVGDSFMWVIAVISVSKPS
jgi:hypothetical protein